MCGAHDSQCEPGVYTSQGHVRFLKNPNSTINIVCFCFQNFVFDLCAIYQMQTTPLKINMEHNHGGLEDHFPF